MMHSLQGPAVKIVENNLGRTYAKVTQQLIFQMPMTGQGPVPGTIPQPPGLS